MTTEAMLHRFNPAVRELLCILGAELVDIHIADIKTEKIWGRAKQDNDNKQVVELVRLLEDGVPFHTCPIVTRDFVLVDGHGRHEAYSRFLTLNPEMSKAVPCLRLNKAAFVGASDSLKQKLDVLSLLLNVHLNGRAASARDLRYHVRELLDADVSPNEIKKTLCVGGLYRSSQIERAIRDAKKVETQAAVKHAQELVKEGCSPEKALKKAGLPTDYKLVAVDRDRLHKVRDRAEAMAANWSRFVGTRIADYIEDGRGQAELTNIATNYIACADVLVRKAQAIQTLVNEAIQKRAKRERR